MKKRSPSISASLLPLYGCHILICVYPITNYILSNELWTFTVFPFAVDAPNLAFRDYFTILFYLPCAERVILCNFRLNEYATMRIAGGDVTSKRSDGAIVAPVP